MLYPDYEEFVAALNARGVRYLIIGAHAVALHARPRATKDLDILIAPELENAQRTLQAITDFFGGANPGYTIEDFADPSWIIQIGVPPVRIDILMRLEGHHSFELLWEHRIEAPFGLETAPFVSLRDLIQAKQATDRPQDRADVRILQLAEQRERKRPEK